MYNPYQIRCVSKYFEGNNKTNIKMKSVYQKNIIHEQYFFETSRIKCTTATTIRAPSTRSTLLRWQLSGGEKKILWWILVVDLCGCVLSLLTIMVMLLLLTIVAIFWLLWLWSIVMVLGYCGCWLLWLLMGSDDITPQSTSSHLVKPMKTLFLMILPPNVQSLHDWFIVLSHDFFCSVTTSNVWSKKHLLKQNITNPHSVWFWCVFCFCWFFHWVSIGFNHF